MEAMLAKLPPGAEGNANELKHKLAAVRQQMHAQLNAKVDADGGAS